MTEHKPRFLDLKLPLGVLLAFYGVVLTLYGLFTNAEFYKKSLGIDANLVWGLVLLVIGVVILVGHYLTKEKQ
jgi:hypothetical protein